MGSQWTNKYAILRDLSVAQGRKVPAKIVGSVGIGQKPPALKMTEETEEEFFQNYTGDAELYAKPDLNMIKEMINMLKANDLGDNEGTDIEVFISKLKPLSNTYMPTNMEVGTNCNKTTNKIAVEQANAYSNVAKVLDISIEADNVNNKKEVKTIKKRRERNVALISLLEKEKASGSKNSPRDENISSTINEMFENKSDTTNNKPNVEVKLLKPNDFILDTNVTEAVEKVNEWLQKPAELQQAKAKQINPSTTNMFKMKNSPILSLQSTSMFRRKSDSSSNKSSDSDAVPRQASDNVFVPSTHANEYYKKFVERRQIQEIAQEDIWKRAERLMNEIDTKREKDKETMIIQSLVTAAADNVVKEDDVADKGESSLPINIAGLHKMSVPTSILLPQHRHDLPEECKVCLALAKYRQKNEPAASR